MTSPVELTAIDAPGWRGALPRTSTTVARANGSPLSHQAVSSVTRSRMCHRRHGSGGGGADAGDEAGELFQSGKAVTGHELVNARKRRGHPGRHRGEARTPGPGVGPDDPMRQP